MRIRAAVWEPRTSHSRFSQVVTAYIQVQALKKQLLGTKSNSYTCFLIATRSVRSTKQVTDHGPITQSHFVRFAHANDTRNLLSFWLLWRVPGREDECCHDEVARQVWLTALISFDCWSHPVIVSQQFTHPTSTQSVAERLWHCARTHTCTHPHARTHTQTWHNVHLECAFAHILFFHLFFICNIIL